MTDKVIDVEVTTTVVADLSAIKDLDLKTIVDKAWENKEIDNVRGALAFPDTEKLGLSLKQQLSHLGLIGPDGEALEVEVTDENIKETKELRADINRVINEVDTARKARKKDILADWSEFEASLKEDLTNTLNSVETKLGVAINDHTKNGYKAIEERYQALWVDLTTASNVPFIPYSATNIVVNSAMNDTKARKMMEDAIELVTSQLEIASQLDNSEMVIAEYKTAGGEGFLNLQQAMRTVNERIRIANEVAQAQAQAQAVQPEPVPVAPVAPVAPTPIPEPVQEPTMTGAEEAPQLIKVTMSVVGVLEDISKLNEFAVANNLSLVMIGNPEAVSPQEVFLMKYDLIATGSKEHNALLLNGNVLVDVGVIPSKLKKTLASNKIDYVLLTHHHGDHFNKGALKSIVKANPLVTILTPTHMINAVRGLTTTSGERIIRDRHILEIVPDRVYQLGGMYFSAHRVVHANGDMSPCPNVAWKIKIGTNKILYVTDTNEISHLNAKGFNYYFVEMNYRESELDEKIRLDIEEVGFSHRVRSRDTHLSIEKAERALEEWVDPTIDYTIVPLHMSSNYELEFKELYKGGKLR